MTRAFVLGLLLAGAVAHADDAVDVARTVFAPAVDTAALTNALQAKDAVTRATAARVALIRDVRSLVPQLRDALKGESSAEAAREQVRALVILGGDADVAFAAAELPRFPSGIDSAFADAIARLGAPRAIQLFFTHVAKTRSPSMQWELALWGRNEQLPLAASRVLGARDATAWTFLLNALDDAKLPLDPALALTALRSDNAEIVVATLWHLLRLHAPAPETLPALAVEEALRMREGASDEEAFLRELLRRARGAAPDSRKEWIEVAGREGVRLPLLAADIQRLLTKAERDAVDKDKFPMPRKPAAPLPPPPFRFSVPPPAGLASRILSAERCRSRWIGTPRANVDRAGRVVASDTSSVLTDTRCQKALRTLIALSLAEPRSIDSPLESGNLLVAVNADGRAACLDEPRVSSEPALGSRRIGGRVKAPKVKRRVEPVYPGSLLKQNLGVVTVTMEAVITRTGCVRDIHLIEKSSHAEFNGSAVLALSQWTFEPGTFDGVPVDVVFNLTISYRH